MNEKHQPRWITFISTTSATTNPATIITPTPPQQTPPQPRIQWSSFLQPLQLSLQHSWYQPKQPSLQQHFVLLLAAALVLMQLIHVSFTATVTNHNHHSHHAIAQSVYNTWSKEAWSWCNWKGSTWCNWSLCKWWLYPKARTRSMPQPKLFTWLRLVQLILVESEVTVINHQHQCHDVTAQSVTPSNSPLIYSRHQSPHLKNVLCELDHNPAESCRRFGV